MCFVNDYDWGADIAEKEELVASEATACYECGRNIPQGDKYIYRYWQECEDCDDCGEYYEDCVCEGQPVVGESIEMNTCVDCEKFRKSIIVVELDEGCGRSEAEPCHGEMFYECQQNGEESSIEYLRRLRRDFPETVRSGYFKLAVGKLLSWE